MRLTAKEYVEILKRNPSLRPTEDNYQSPRESPKLEQSNPDALPKSNEVKGRYSSQSFIIFTDVRKRLLDDDNLCEKFHCDRLRYESVIVNDSTEHYRIFTTQRKCEKGEEPHTLIEIY